jgi:hypothetical protein
MKKMPNWDCNFGFLTTKLERMNDDDYVDEVGDDDY